MHLVEPYAHSVKIQVFFAPGKAGTEEHEVHIRFESLGDFSAKVAKNKGY